MKNKDKTKEQLLEEITAMRQRIAELEISETERKKAEKKLKESEDNYRILVQRNPHGIQKIDIYGTIIYANKAHREMYGYEEGALIGRSITDFLVPGSQCAELPGYLEMLVKNQPSPTPYYQKILTKRGKERDIEVTWNYLRDTKGGVVGFLSVLTDITVRKQTDEALRNSNRKYSAIVENANDAIYLIDPETQKILEVNDTACKMTGYSKEELKRMYVYELHPEDERALLPEKFNEVSEKGSVQGISGINQITKDGKLVPIEVNATMIELDGKELNVSIVRDISERKKAEKALRESEEKFRVITQGSPAMVYQTDKDGKCIFANQNWHMMTGLTEEETMGDGWVNGLYADDRELVYKNWEKMVKSKGKWGLEYRLQNREGEVIWVYGTASPIYDEKGEIVSYVGINTDITDRKKAAEELQEAHALLEKRVKERTLELSESNATLKVLLNQREQDKGEFESNILSNVKHLVLPYILKLKKNRLESDELSYLNIIESNLKEIISPFSQKLSSVYMEFTPREIQIANFIKDGSQDKDIMEILNISLDTVKTHRKKIRRKLGIYGKRINLRTKLLSMT